MEHIYRIGKHLIAPALIAYLLHLSSLDGPLAKEYLSGAMIALFLLGVGYGTAWFVRTAWEIK